MSVELAFNRSADFPVGVAEQVAPQVRRIVANNPGPLTFTGTNTYLVGEGDVALIDPGPDDRAHIDAVAQATRGEKISHILITHAHRDHTEAWRRFKALTGAPVMAIPRAGDATGPDGDRFIDKEMEIDRALEDGATIRGAGWSIDVIHTPGHAPDHACFAVSGQRVVLTGDHVMGWNTSMVAPPEGHMGDYIRSLEKLLTRRDLLFLPGHGGEIRTPQRAVKAYIMHRKWREQAVLACVADGLTTIGQMVPRIYGRLDSALAAPAALSVYAHLELLIERGLVRSDGAERRLEAAFHPA
jgi:glyoxylase-like metal-dependent hydrolase (beta-lactamase superfamily II)